MLNIDTRILMKLDESELKLLFLLANRMNEQNKCWPSNALLCQETGWNIEKVQRVKSRLIEKKYIHRDKKSSGKRKITNTYTILSKEIKKYNGKSDTGKSDTGFSAINASGKSDFSIPENTSTEVLQREVLENEVLGIFERSENICVEIIELFYPKIFENINQLSVLEKKFTERISKVAAQLLEHYKQERSVPDYRTNLFDAEYCSIRETRQQIKAYHDYIRLTKKDPADQPERIAQEIIRADWCLKLYEYARNNMNKYDSYEDKKLLSDWLHRARYFEVTMEYDDWLDRYVDEK